MTFAKPSQLRRAVTIIEVLFATGILLVGLYGLIILIPLAGRQALESYAYTQTTAASQNAFREFQARGFHYPSRNRPWLFCEDVALGGVPGVAVYDQPPAYYNAFATPAFIPLRSYKELVQYHAGKLVASGLAVDTAQSVASQYGYCIDPLFWSAQPLNGTDPILAGTEAGYRRSRFPYYQDGLNPLENPASPSNAWANQPRMARITFPSAPLSSTSAVYPAITTGFVPIKGKLAQKMFASSDDVTNPISDSDGSVNGIRGFYTATTGDVLQNAVRQNVSWLATLTPLEQDTATIPSAFTLSIVAFHNRDRAFEAPSSSPTIPADPNDLPDAERMAWAVPPDLATYPAMGTGIPFSTEAAYSGTNGFDLELYANGNVKSRIKPGEWIMLSRELYFSPTSSRHIHKWYRVVSVSEEPEEIGSAGFPSLTDPYGNTYPSANVPVVWRQTVHVVGPDWIFSQRMAPGGFAQCPTIATIVPNVLSVYERVVDIPWE